MKKNLILLMCLFLTLGISAQQYKDWSKWSIAVEGGINVFDGDITKPSGYAHSVIKNTDFNAAVGGLIEYTPSPMWSIGVDYYYLPLSANTNFREAGNYSFEATMHNVSLFTSVNALKAFFPRTKTKWGLWGGFGLGYATYKTEYITASNGNLINTGWGQVPDRNYKNDNGKTMFVPLNFLLEYNVSNSIALGLKGQFRGFFVDDIDGRTRANANDALEMATLQLRYKFCANKNPHTRNGNMFDFGGFASPDDIDNLQKQLDALVIPEAVGPDPRIDDLEGRLKKLEDYLDIDGPDDDNDGVANSRDQEPNTPAGNQVDFWGRTIPKGTTYDPSAFIFFDFDKTDLDEEAYKAIHLAAQKLQADPSLLVEVRGFTDNMGSDAYNANLSQRRADKVKAELVNAYGIDADRIIANGKGKYNPDDKTIPYRPYRTASFFYSK